MTMSTPMRDLVTIGALLLLALALAMLKQCDTQEAPVPAVVASPPPCEPRLTYDAPTTFSEDVDAMMAMMEANQ